jgi:acyl-CoA reductase-like NAD-dependent aldehyde dehydrogenase
VDEVLAKATDTPNGPAAYVHTADPERLGRLVDGIDAEVVVGNGFGNLTPATPFGGVKYSGFGREGGRPGLEEMVQP